MTIVDFIKQKKVPIILALIVIVIGSILYFAYAAAVRIMGNNNDAQRIVDGATPQNNIPTNEATNVNTKSGTLT